MPAPKHPADRPLRLAAHSFKAQLFNPSPPDFEVRSRDYMWRVHLDVFAEKSDFFRALRDNSFRKGQEQSVILHDERPALVARLMLWIYYGEYRVYGNHTGEGLCLNDLMSSTLTTAPQVTNSTEQPIALTMAETVDPALSGFAIASDPQPGGQAQPQTTSQPPIPPSNAPRQPGHLRKVEIDIHWSMYMIADKYGCPELRRYCVKQMFMVTRLEHGAAGIWHIVQYAKSASMPVQDVQEEIISFFMLHFRYFGEDPRFKDLVKTTPELAWALVSAYSRHGLLYPGRTA